MQELERKLGYRFRSGALLAEALRHSSYANEHRGAESVSNERLETLLCHEIWHAMEDKLISENWNAIDSWTWSACNPRGFDYYYDYDDAMNEADGSWLYFGTAEDVYFVDAYSTMNPREDRARIMEYIMGAEDVADALAQHPVIRRKLEIMAAAAGASPVGSSP